MVSDPPDAPSTDSGLDPVEHYEVTYRATRAALWDVIGTATYVLFLVAVALVGFYVVVGNGLTVAGDDGTTAHVAFLLVGAAMLLAAGTRLYGLYRG
jgi:hypothetical protein